MCNIPAESPAANVNDFEYEQQCLCYTSWYGKSVFSLAGCTIYGGMRYIRLLLDHKL